MATGAPRCSLTHRPRPTNFPVRALRRRLLALALRFGTALALPLSPALAQDVVYDDGGVHVLDAYPVPDSALVDVRDGPGGDPTQLDVSIDDDLYTVSFRAYGSSSVNLLAIGYAIVNTYDDARATIAPGTSPGGAAFSNRLNTYDRSQAVVNDSMWSTSAYDESRITLADGASVSSHLGRGISQTVMTGGVAWGLNLQSYAVMHVFGGRPGGDFATVSGHSYLNVVGGSFNGTFGGLSVRERARVDIHAGEVLPSSLFSYRVSDFGFLRLFGTDFLLDGLPIGPGNITALAGGALRTGTLSGVLESGESIQVPFQVSGSGIIRIVPEPGTGMLVAAALAATLATPRLRAARARLRARAPRTPCW